MPASSPASLKLELQRTPYSGCFVLLGPQLLGVGSRLPFASASPSLLLAPWTSGPARDARTRVRNPISQLPLLRDRTPVTAPWFSVTAVVLLPGWEHDRQAGEERVQAGGRGDSGVSAGSRQPGMWRNTRRCRGAEAETRNGGDSEAGEGMC